MPLIGLALSAAREAQERANGPSLFDGFDRYGRGADSISAKINKAIRAAGVPRSPRLVAYSFRHGIAEALRRVGAPYHVARPLLGHSTREMADHYGAPQHLIEAQHWLGRALDVLGDVDDITYTDAERMESPTERH